MGPNEFTLEVWGELACFTRPELKVERFSYPCPTPSAVRNMFDAIFLDRHSFHWQVTSIEILRPLAFIALRRNEVKEKISVTSAVRWISGKAPPAPIFADVDEQFLGTDQKGRTQRQTIALRDVRYRLSAEIRRWPNAEKNEKALADSFARRARHGKCWYQPYLGCREFPAYFRLVEQGEEAASPAPVDLDLGLMLYDVFDLTAPSNAVAPAAISLFKAEITNGVLTVPPFESTSVFKTERAV